MSGILAFLGGSAFRMIWGEVAAAFTASKDHKYELERLRLQKEVDDAAHARNMAALRVQSELGIKEIYVKSEAAVTQAEVDAWKELAVSTSRPTGIKWVDAWNQSIRPFLATCAILALMVEAYHLGVLTVFTQEVLAAAIGLFLADRGLSKRGK